jgi:hypothetical protein
MNDLAIRIENIKKRYNSIISPARESEIYLCKENDELCLYLDEENIPYIAVNVKIWNLHYCIDDVKEYIEREYNKTHTQLFIKRYITHINTNWDELFNDWCEMEYNNFIEFIENNKKNPFHARIIKNNEYGQIGRNGGWFAIERAKVHNKDARIIHYYKRLINQIKKNNICDIKIIKTLEFILDYFDYWHQQIQKAKSEMNFGEYIEAHINLYFNENK